MGFGEPQFAGEAILQHTPETLDAPFGLRAVGGNEGDAELCQGPAELRGLELRRRDFAGGVVLQAESGEERTAAFKPVVRTAVELHEFRELGGRHPALSGRAQTVLAEQSARVSRLREKPSCSTSFSQRW